MMGATENVLEKGRKRSRALTDEGVLGCQSIYMACMTRKRSIICVFIFLGAPDVYLYTLSKLPVAQRWYCKWSFLGSF